MSQSHLINKDSVNSVPWEKDVTYCWKVLYAKFLWNCFCFRERSNLLLLCYFSGCPCSPEVPVLGVSLRFKRGGIFSVGKKMGNELRRDFLRDPGNFGDNCAADRQAWSSKFPSAQLCTEHVLVSACLSCVRGFVPNCNRRATAVCYGRSV